MTNEERNVLVEGFTQLALTFGFMARFLEEGTSEHVSDNDTENAPEQDVEQAPEPTPTEPPVPVQEKTYTYEEVRAILAEKARTGFRAEVKAILTANGIKQLSDVKDQETFAAIVKEAEEIGNG